MLVVHIVYVCSESCMQVSRSCGRSLNGAEDRQKNRCVVHVISLQVSRMMREGVSKVICR